MQKKYKFIDLFCGCGGFSYGLEMAGHECLLGVDFNKEAVESFKLNHPKAQGIHTDISKLTKAKLSKIIDIDSVDMVVGGPPCQGFSTAGRGREDDTRNQLFKEFVRVVKITNPKVILFENVTGLLAQKNRKVLEQIYKSFTKLGYVMDAKVMSAEEYGVPSRRRRTIIMGVKNGVPSFPEITHSKPVDVKKALSSLNRKNIKNHDTEKAKLKSKVDTKRLEFIPAGKGIRYERDEKEYLPKRLRYDVIWSEIRENRFRQTRLQRIPLKGPAPTILTSRTTYYHPVEPRYLTPREAACLQSFPNQFEFFGSLTAQFRQIGNAVPPLLAKELGEHIKKMKFNKRSNLKIVKDISSINMKEVFYYKNERKHA